MSATRRTQILMDPEEFRKLQGVARQRRTSVAELFRTAVREKYLNSKQDRSRIVSAILAMGLPRIDWERAKEDIESGHADIS